MPSWPLVLVLRYRDPFDAERLSFRLQLLFHLTHFKLDTIDTMLLPTERASIVSTALLAMAAMALLYLFTAVVASRRFMLKLRKAGFVSIRDTKSHARLLMFNLAYAQV